VTREGSDYDTALDAARDHAREWLNGMPTRAVGPRTSADTVRQRAGALLSAPAATPAAVVDEPTSLVEPGLMAIGSGRFFGWVMGGTLLAALGADWLVGAWDQNAGMRYATPGVVGVEEAAADALLDVLGLPRNAGVGFTTGGTTANSTCLAAGRHAVLARAGWDVETDGLAGGPRIRVLVGDEEHVSIDLALRGLGLGRPERVAADAQGRIRLDALPPRWRTSLPERPPCCAYRRATCTPGRSTRSARPLLSRTGTEPGYTSTAHSGCGRRHPQRCGTCWPGTRPPTPGRAMLTRR